MSVGCFRRAPERFGDELIDRLDTRHIHRWTRWPDMLRRTRKPLLS